jgi:hypothetical protein
MLNYTVDHILQEFYILFLTRFRTYKIATPPQTKMTSKDDIKGLVSLKFLRPWVTALIELSKYLYVFVCPASPEKRRPTRCRFPRRVDSAGPVSPTCFYSKAES